MMTSGLSGRLGEKGWIESSPKRAPKRHLLVDGDVLVAQHDHLVVHEGVVHDGELLVRERPAQIDAFDLGADEAIDRPDADFGFALQHGCRPGCGLGRHRFLHASC
jgi:hypothetical protein